MTLWALRLVARMYSRREHSSVGCSDPAPLHVTASLCPPQAVWSGQLSVLNQAQLSFDATVVGGAGDWAQLLPDSQVSDWAFEPSLQLL